MNELRARGYGEGGANGGAAKKRQVSGTSKPAVTGEDAHSYVGVVYASEAEFAHVEECIQKRLIDS